MTQNGTYWLSKVSEGQIEEGISTKGRMNFSTEFATIPFFFQSIFNNWQTTFTFIKKITTAMSLAVEVIILLISINC